MIQYEHINIYKLSVSTNEISFLSALNRSLHILPHPVNNRIRQVNVPLQPYCTVKYLINFLRKTTEPDFRMLPRLTDSFSQESTPISPPSCVP